MTDLGDDWTYRHTGMGMTPPNGRQSPWYQSVSVAVEGVIQEGFSVYGRPDSSGAQVGARMSADTRCPGCGKPPAAQECWTADLAPNMAGMWHHTDCDDPKLERDDNERVGVSP